MTDENEIPKFFEVEEQAGTPCGCSAPDCEEDGYPFAFGIGDDFPGYVEACPKHARRIAWEMWLNVKGG